MSSGTATKIVGAAVVAAVAFSAGSFWVGGWVEQVFRDSAAEAAQYGLKITVIDYQRGVFGAVARTEAVFPASGGEEPVTVLFNHSIQHGPVPAFTAAARIRSEPLLPEGSVEQLNEIFGGDPFAGAPLAIDSTFDWGGGLRHRIVLPKKFEATFNGDNESSIRVAWDGIDGEIGVYSGLTRLEAKIGIGSFSLVRNVNDKIQIERATLDGEVQMNGGDLDIHAKFGADKIATEGNVRKTIDKLTLEGQADVKGEALDVTVKFAVAEIVREAESREAIDNAKMTLLLRNLDVGVLGAIFNAILQADDEQAALMVAQGQSVKLLQRQPDLSIKDASAHWPEGEIALNFHIGYVGAGDPGQSALAETNLADIVADWQLSLPRALASRFIGEQMYEDEIEANTFDDGESEEGSEPVRKPTKEQIDQHIADMVGNGIFVEKNGAL
ncbi:MAG: YdgA family protein, partial [Azoarcus sp.]|nr:YdgA family protein [Azoarcus sp.]